MLETLEKKCAPGIMPGWRKGIPPMPGYMAAAIGPGRPPGYIIGSISAPGGVGPRPLGGAVTAPPLPPPLLPEPFFPAASVREHSWWLVHTTLCCHYKSAFV